MREHPPARVEVREILTGRSCNTYRITVYDYVSLRSAGRQDRQDVTEAHRVVYNGIRSERVNVTRRYKISHGVAPLTHVAAVSTNRLD